MDATRDEVIYWCRINRVNFRDPIYPPPEGWMWADNGDDTLLLTSIFTNTHDEDIRLTDICL